MAFSQSVLDGRQHADALRNIVRQAARPCLLPAYNELSVSSAVLLPSAEGVHVSWATCAWPPPRAASHTPGDAPPLSPPASTPSPPSIRAGRTDKDAPRSPGEPRPQDPPPRRCVPRALSRASCSPPRRRRARARCPALPREVRRVAATLLRPSPGGGWRASAPDLRSLPLPAAPCRSLPHPVAPLPRPAARPRCEAAARPRCEAPLPRPAAKPRCEAPLRSPAAKPRCEAPLRSPAARPGDPRERSSAPIWMDSWVGL
jgi:hypothetical protein